MAKKYLRDDDGNVRIMPHSKDAEESVLGSILLDNNCYDKIVRHISNPEVFYYKKHRTLYNIIQNLLKEGVVADLVTVSSRITNDDFDIYWLTGLSDAVVSVANVETHSKLIYEKYLHRKIIKETYKIQKVAYDDNFGFFELIDKIRGLNEEVLDTKPIKSFSLKEVSKDTIESIDNRENLINFGFKVLDGMAGGMTKGEITVIAGRPGHGKTTFAVNLTKKLLDQELKVLVINREMTNKEMMKKLFVLHSGKLSYHNVRTGSITEVMADEIDKVSKDIINKYDGLLTMYDDVSSLPETISIVSRLRPDIVIDDYIQLVRVPDKTDRRFEIEAVMQEYKWIAKKYKIVPILVSQLNRDIERRIDPIPKMSDLAESSSIEQVAENILFIYYDYKVNYGSSALGKMKSQIVAAKVRYGTSGMFTIGVDHNKVLYHEEIPEIIDMSDMIHVDTEEELKSVIAKFSPKTEKLPLD